MDELKVNLEECKRTMEPKVYKFELLICFWVCIHLGKCDFAKLIAAEDKLIDRLLDSVRGSGRMFLIELIAKRLHKKDNVKTNNFGLLGSIKVGSPK